MLWNYFRVYLPGSATDVVAPLVPLNQGGEKLIWGYSDADSRSLDRRVNVGPARLTEIGGFIDVEPDSVVAVPLEYRLPWETVRSTGPSSYECRLLIDKQPGIDDDFVTVVVQLPPGSEVIAVSPEPKTSDDGRMGFEFRLDTDMQVSVAFKAGGS